MLHKIALLFEQALHLLKGRIFLLETWDLYWEGECGTCCRKESLSLLSLVSASGFLSQRAESAVALRGGRLGRT